MAVHEQVKLHENVAVSQKGDHIFDSLLTQMKFGSAADTQLAPMGLLIRNQGLHVIVGYSIHWTFDDGGGDPLVKEQNYIESFALNDGDMPGPGRSYGDIVLGPGSHRLVTPSVNLSVNIESPAYAAPASGPWGDAVLREFNGYATKKPLKSVRLVAVALDNGTCIKEEATQLCSALQGQVDAIQDVLQAAKRVENGEDSASIASAIKETLTPRTSPESLEADIYHAHYELIRDSWIRRLQNILDTKGKERLVAEVNSRIYRIKPTITPESEK
jgi:hypothetical protein